MTFRPLPLMSVFSALSLALLIWLGNWQYGKFRSKIAADAESPAWTVLEGDVIGGSDVLLYAYADGISGWQRLIAVDAGDQVIWTSVELMEEIHPPGISPLAPEAARLKFSARGLFTSPSGKDLLGGADKPESRLFQTFDATRISGHLDAAMRARLSPQLFQPEAIRFIREGRAFDGPNPLALSRPDAGLPAQRHFGYALTWWGLAAALIGVYAAYHAMTGRLTLGGRRRD